VDAKLEAAFVGDRRGRDFRLRLHARGPEKARPVAATHRSASESAESMGGRIGCHVSLEEKVDGLVCLGYPLCAMGDRTKLRDEVLRAMTTPILFVQGTRDALCPLDLLEGARADMIAPNFLHVVEGGDHSLRVPKRHLQAKRETQEDIDQRIFEAVAGFIDQFAATAD
jgi:predicted alpha/beta-hydrolase family hydrolase